MSGGRRETIVFLLERMEDALMERTSSNGRSQHESVSLLAGPWWGSPAFQELDRCLDLMRSQGRQRAVSFASGKSCSLGCARWHVLAWHVQVEHRTTTARQPLRDKHGKQKRDKNGNARTERVLELKPQRHRDARQDRADAGVEWIVGEFRKWTAADTVRGRWEDRIGHEREKEAA